MSRAVRKPSGRLVGIRRLSRASLLRGTALQAAVLVAVELPGGILPALAQPAPNAQPQGGRVTAGQASITQNPTTTTIDQSSQRAAIDWSSFNVGRNQTVDFQQPSSSAWTLNRVAGPDPSQIAGRIDANGNVVLTNAAGVVFYRGSEVNANSLVVSAPGITNRNFMAGRMVFDRPANPNARIVNAGSLTVKQAGLAALVAPQVVNRGVITAKFGHVELAGARTDTLDMYGDGLFSFDVTGAVRQVPRGPDGKPVTALVTNSGVVRADGGTVQLTARAADGIVQNLVDAKGRTQANTAGAETGNIDIEGTGGSIKIAGDVSATGRQPAQQGGQVELNATRNVVLGRSAVVDASGGAGGGTVAVGTTLARANGGPSVTPTRTAARVRVRHGATVSADATGYGTGGKVTVLSKRATAMRGTITAQGGPAGGNGGSVEVSGERDFALTGTVNVGNRGSGQTGTILLDPTNLTIVSGASGSGNEDGFVGSNGGTLRFNQGSADATVSNGELDALTGNIVLQASNDLTAKAGFSGSGTVDLRAGHLLTVASGTTIGVTITADDVILHGGENFSTGGATGKGGVVIGANSEIAAFTTFGTSGHGTIEIAGGSLGVQMNGFLISTNAIDLVATGGNVGLGASSELSTTAVDISTVRSGNVLQTGTNGRIFATTLQSSQGVAGNVNLNSTGNQFQTLENFAATGSLSVTDAIPSDPSVTGTVTSPIGITIDSVGPLTISGFLTAPTISLTATEPFFFEPGVIDQTGGSIDAAKSLILNAAGSIAQSNGAVIVAGTLSGSEGNNLGEGQSSGTVLNSLDNRIANVGNFTSVGGFTLTDATALTLSGNLKSEAPGGQISLTTTGGILQTGGAITASGLNAAAGGSILLTSTSNAIADLFFVSSTGGDISITSKALHLFEGVTVSRGHSIDLTTDTLGFVRAGALNAPAGTVILEPLTAGRPVDLGSANAAGGLNILPTDLPRITAKTLQIGSPTAGTVNVGDFGTTFTDTIDLTALINGNATHAIPVLDLASGAAVTEGGILKVGTLTGNVGTAEGGPGTVVLNNGSNSIATLGSFSADGNFLLTDAAPLSVAGPVTDPANVTLDPPSITITGLVSAAGTLDLVAFDLSANGTLAETAGGTVDAGVLTGSASDSISLTSRSNRIGTVEFLAADNGNLLLTDNESLAISGLLFATTTVNLVVKGTVRETGSNGQINAPELSGSADQANLTATFNSVGQLGSFAATNGFTLVDDQPLTVTGPVTGGTRIAITADGDLTASGSIVAPTVALTTNIAEEGTSAILQTAGIIDGSTRVVLTAFGSIDQTGGSLIAGTLSGSSGSTTSLTGATNAIATLGSFTTTGGFALTDGEGLTVAGPVTDHPQLIGGVLDPVTLNVTGPLTLTGTITSPDIISLTATGTIDQTSGALIAASGTLTGSGAGVTLGQGGNKIANLGAFTSSGNFLLADSVPVTIAATTSVGTGATLTIQDNNYTIGTLGALNATPTGTIVLEPLTTGTPVSLTGNSGAAAFTADTLVFGSTTAGPLTIGGTVDLSNVNVLDVLSGKSITESAGAVLTVGELEGSAGGSANFGATNSITTLGSFSAGGSLVLNDALALTVAGPIDPTNVTLTAPSLTIGGLVSASGTVDLTASSGTISEPGGTVDAHVLTGSAQSDLSLNSSANAIGTVEGLLAFGNLSLTDSENLVIFNPQFGGFFLQGTTVDLVVNGTLSQAGLGSGIFANELIGSAVQANLTSGNNAVGQLGSFTATDGFALSTGAGGLTVSGPVTAGTSIALAVVGGLTVAGDVVAPSVDLKASNFVGEGRVPGDILQTGGSIGGSTNVVLTAAGSIDQTGGVLATASLSGSSHLTTSLTDSGNTVANLGSFQSHGGFALTDGEALTVAGPVTDTAKVTLNVTGALALGGTVTAPDIALTATGAITQPSGALIASHTLSGSGAGVALGQGGNQVADLGSFISTGNFLLADSVPVTIAAKTSVGTGATLTIEDNSYTIGASGALDATPTGTIVLEPLTPGTPVALNGNSGTKAFTADTLVLGSSKAGPITITGTVNLTNVNVLDVLSGSSITEAGGAVLTVGELEGSAGGSANFGATNSITTLGSFSAGGSLLLNDALGLTVAGPIDPTDVTLIAPSVTITGLVSASGTVDLLATTGSITEPGGTVETSVLTGSAATSISLNGPKNLIGTVDALSAQAGNLLLTDNESLVIFGAPSPGGALFGTTVDLAVTGTVSEAGTGQIIATELIGTANQANLTAPTNLVSALGSFGAVKGFTLVDGEALSVPGPVTAGTAIALTATGDLTASGSIAAPTIALTTTTPGQGPSDILQTGGTIAGSSSVTLTAAGSIDQSGGVLSTPRLGGIGTSITLVGTNTIAALGGMTATTGNFTIADTSNLAIGGAVSAAGTFDVIAPGVTVSEPAGGSITAATLTGQVGAAKLGQPDNGIANLGAFTSTGAFFLADGVPLNIAAGVSTGTGASLTIQDNTFTIGALGALNATPSGTIVLEPFAGQSFTLAGPTTGALPFTAATLAVGGSGATIEASSVTLGGNLNLAGVGVLDVLSRGSIGEAGGTTLTVGPAGSGELEGQAGGAATFGATNSIGTLGGFSADGGFLLADATGLTVAGPVLDPPNITLTAPLLTIIGLISASGTVDLIATTGSISEPGGTVDAGILTGSAQTSVSLISPANSIATLDAFGANTGAFALADIGNLVIGGEVFGATVDLATTGTLSEAAGGIVATPTLDGTVGAGTLDQANLVRTLGAFASGAGFVLNNAEPLSIAGPVTGSAIALTSIGPLTVTGSIAAPAIDLTAVSGLVDRVRVVGNILQTGGSIDGSTSVVLTAAGSIDQSAGALTAGTLSGSSGATTNLPSTTNAVANLGSFTSVGGFTLGDGRALAVAGPVTDTASITLGVNGALALGGTVTAPDVSLTASGAITQPGGAILASGTLSGSGAGVTLGQAGNKVANLGAFTSTGDFLLADSVPVTIANAVSVGGRDTLTIADNAFTIGAAGVLNATTTGTIVLEPLTSGTAMNLTGIAAALPFTANTVVLGSAAAGPITISNDVNFAKVAVLDVLSNASVAEAGGATLTVGALEGQVRGSANFAATNFVGTLAGFSAGGSFVLDSAESLRVSGPVTATPTIAITDIGTLTVAGVLSAGTVDLTARSGTFEGSSVRGDIIENTGGAIGVAGSTDLVSLTADGLIDQLAGVLDTATLQGSSHLTTSLANPSGLGNAVTTLATFSSVGGFALSDGQALTLTGPVTDTASVNLKVAGALTLAGVVTAPDVSLTATGAITQPAGAIVASGTLSGSGAGVTLGQAGNQVADLGSFTSSGAFLLADNVPVTIAAAVSVSGGETLAIEDNRFTIGTAGVLSAPGGTIVLEPLTSGAAFALTGPATGALPFSANTLVLGSAAAGSVTIANDVNLSGVALLDVLSGGAVSEAAGTLTVGALEGQAGGAASFTGNNQIATLGRFSSKTGFSLADGRALTVVGPVNDGTRVSLTIAGDLTLTGAVSAPAVRVAVNGAFTEQGGSIGTGTLSGRAASATLLATDNTIASLGDFSTPGGLALNDATALAIAGAVNGGSAVTLTVQGGLTLASGALSSTGAMVLNVAGPITDQSGAISASSLGGTALGLAQFGGSAPGAIASIGTLAGFSVQAGTLALTDAVPLTITGLTSADDLAITARGSIVLSGGTIATLGLPLAQQLGAAPAAPGSFLQVVPGTNGTGQFVQLGVTTIATPTGGSPTLRIDVPNGGTIALNDLVGPSTNLVLADVGGPIGGTIDLSSLHVLGSAGDANLFGTVAGNSTPGAAAISFISPAVNPNYLLNLCVIMSPICGGLPINVTAQDPQLLVPEQDQLTATLASAVAQLQLFFTRPLVAGVAPECRVVGTLATLTDQCIEIILPNISDRDY